jgi:hypothetical protein
MKNLMSVLLVLFWFTFFPMLAFAEDSGALHGGDWIYLLGLLIPVANQLAKKTRTDFDDKAVGFFGNLLSILGGRWKRVRLL